MSLSYERLVETPGVLPAALQRRIMRSAGAVPRRWLARLLQRCDLDPGAEELLLEGGDPSALIVWLASHRMRPERAEALIDAADPELARELAGCAGLSQDAYLRIGCSQISFGAAREVLVALACNPSVGDGVSAEVLLHVGRTFGSRELFQLLNTTYVARAALERHPPAHAEAVRLLPPQLGLGELALVVRLEGVTAEQHEGLVERFVGGSTSAGSWPLWLPLLTSPHATAATFEAMAAAMQARMHAVPAGHERTAREVLAAVTGGDRAEVAALELRYWTTYEQIHERIRNAGPDELAALHDETRDLDQSGELSPTAAVLCRPDLPPEVAGEVAYAGQALEQRLLTRIRRGDGRLDTDVTLALAVGKSLPAALLERRGPAGAGALARELCARVSGPQPDGPTTLTSVAGSLAGAGHLREVPAALLPELLRTAPVASLVMFTEELDDVSFEILDALQPEFTGTIGELLEVARRLAANPDGATRRSPPSVAADPSGTFPEATQHGRERHPTTSPRDAREPT